ncbi:unnamed protein product [Closterium sp. NIES-53]
MRRRAEAHDAPGRNCRCSRSSRGGKERWRGGGTAGLVTKQSSGVLEVQPPPATTPASSQHPPPKLLHAKQEKEEEAVDESSGDEAGSDEAAGDGSSGDVAAGDGAGDGQWLLAMALALATVAGAFANALVGRWRSP